MIRNRGNDKKKKICEYLFIFSYFLFVFNTLLGELSISEGFTRAVSIMYLISAYVALFLSLNKISIKKIIAIASALLLSIYFLVATTLNACFVQLFAFSLAAKNIKTNNFIKIDLLLKILLVVIVMSCEIIGITQAKEYYRGADAVRNSFGFHHPNFAGLIFLNIFLDILYLRRNNKISNTIIGVAFYYVIAMVIDSRSAAYGVLIATMLQFVPISNILNTNKKRVIVSTMSLFVMLILSLYFVTVPWNEGMASLDRLLSGRISISRAFYDYYGVGLLGSDFEKYGSMEYGEKQFFVLDNVYLYILIHGGILFLAAMILFYRKRLQTSMESKNKGVFVSLFVFMLIGLMEQATFQPIKNPFLLIADKSEEEK